MTQIRERKRKSKFIHRFNSPKGIVCPHFWILNWAHGCPYGCTYCYLQQTLKFTGYIPTIFTNVKDMFMQVENFLSKHKSQVLSLSAATDPLFWLNYKDYGIVEDLISILDNDKNNNCLLITTKIDNVSKLLNLTSSQNTLISFSINSDFVAKTYESNTPNSIKRLAAAKKLLNANWRVRIRIDPMIPHIRHNSYWRTGYSNLIQKISPQIERITLGSLRYYNGLYKRLNGLCRISRDGSDGRYRVPISSRLQMYSLAIEKLNDIGIGSNRIGLCKETEKLWEYFPYLDKKKCNGTP